MFCRHEDLKTMLDGNKDNLKLEAMKRIIGVSNYLSLCVFCFFFTVYILFKKTKFGILFLYINQLIFSRI